MTDLTPAQLSELVTAVDAVLDELQDDLVRRAIVHLTAVRDQLRATLPAD